MARKGALVGVGTARGHSPADVIRWPDDPAAHRALDDYLRRVSADPDAERTAELLLAGRRLNFTGADLSGLDLLGAELSGADLTDVRMAGVDLYIAWLGFAQLSGADLSDADLRKVQASHCRARHAAFRGADLQKADLSDANLVGADFNGARLQRVSFSGADLRRTDLRGSHLWTTRLSNARLAGCDVSGAAGLVLGPIDIGLDTPRLIDGSELEEWFGANGAPRVEVYVRAA
ncbi:pentapeptide repeat-containing protein [Nocardia sp. NPDC050697]|uniref:pentapeptide repeat-containing protein n=1 Tax=Nocardia sp. NPDC050697 TaxID=3155158 RepID=UPI0033E53CF6